MVELNKLESHLWEAANILRGPVDAADFKTYIFPLLFFKRISDVYDEEIDTALRESEGDMVFALFPEKLPPPVPCCRLHGHDIVDRNELESVHYMNPQEIKTKLERALHTTITSAEWEFLKGRGLVHDYEITGDWSEFRDGVEDNLKAIRRYRADALREEAGDLVEAPRENSVDRQPEIPPTDLDDRTSDRYLALGALNHSRSGGSAPPRATILGTLLPCGGVDGTIPQWVYVIAAELWVPAEEVARRFRTMQRTLMVDPDPPRTQARAYNVARFVWEVEAAYGERPSWPDLCKLWNDYCKRWHDAPVARRFDNWRDFRTYFLRGEKATLPRYKATNEQITEQVREASNRGEAVAFERWASHVLAATVQPGTR